MKKIKLNTKLFESLVPRDNYFLTLATSIINQQISTKAASSINKRFIALFGRRKITPQNLLLLSEDSLRSVGLSRGKVVYIRDLAAKFLDKTIDPRNFGEMSDEEIAEHLIQVKGIGPWTAHMFLIFALKRPNVLPVGDLAIVKGFERVFGLKKRPNIKQMEKLAKDYAGKHTYLSLHLWNSIDDGSADEMWGA